MTPFVKIKLAVQGMHHWPEAAFPVQFLSQNHRHTFTIRVKIFVKHDNRDVEFIKLKQVIRSWLHSHFAKNQNGDFEFGPESCESLSRKLAFELGGYVNLGEIASISFSEDEEFEGGVETRQ